MSEALLLLLVLLVSIGASTALFYALNIGLLRIGRSPEAEPATEPETEPAAPQCSTCRHFDLDLGQKMLREHRPFSVASEHVPPWKMGASFDEEGNPTEEPSADMLRLEWTDFGVCLDPDAPDRQIVSQADSCDCWRVKL